MGIFPTATVRALVLDSLPPTFELSRAAANNAFGLPMPDLDNRTAVFNLMEATWGSPLPSMAARTATIGTESTWIPCATSLQCMLDKHIPTTVATFVIHPSTDAYALAKAGIGWVMDGVENGEAPPRLNLRDRFYTMLQSMRFPFQTPVDERGRSFPVGLFAPGCIHHGMLQPTIPIMAGNGPGPADVLSVNRTFPLDTGMEVVDFVLSLDGSRLYSTAGLSWTSIVVRGASLEAALSAWVRAIRAGNTSQFIYEDSCVGPSCNPTCLETVSFASADYGADQTPWINASRVLSVVMLAASLGMMLTAYLNPFVDKIDELEGVTVPEAAQMLIEMHAARSKDTSGDLWDPSGFLAQPPDAPSELPASPSPKSEDEVFVPLHGYSDDCSRRTSGLGLSTTAASLAASGSFGAAARPFFKRSTVLDRATQLTLHWAAEAATLSDDDGEEDGYDGENPYARQLDRALSKSITMLAAAASGSQATEEPATGHLRVRNMSYVVKAAEKDGTKVERVLQSAVYSHCRPGVTAVMGPSGAGKTTFLNVAAGKITGGELSGDVYFDSQPVYATKGGRKKAQQMTGFVTQLGTPWEDTLTFRENLQYAAELRIPGATAEKKAMRVETVIAAVEGRRFSDVVTTGLSGGQKRKLSMAIELLSESTRFLFLDEPTSGLDSTSTLSLLTLLKSLGKNGYTILITIHQPRIEVWELFDEVMILATGRMCYQGPPGAAVAFLSHVVQDTNGGVLERPEGSNPADVVIDFLADPANQKIVSAAYAATRTVREARKEVDEHCLALGAKGNHYHVPDQSLRVAVGDSLHRIYAMHCRMSHASGLWAASIMMHVGFAVFTLLYWNPNPSMKVMAILLGVTSPTLLWLGVTLPTIVERLQLVKIEAQEGMGSILEFVIAVTIYTGALVVVMSLAMSVPAFYILHPNPEDQHESMFSTFYAVATLMSWFWAQAAVSISISQIPNDSKEVMMNAIFGLSCLLSGVIITKAQLDSSIGGWVADINPIYYALSIIYVEAFGAHASKCEYESSFFNCGVLNPENDDPENVLLGFGMRTTDLDMCWTIVSTAAPAPS